MLDRQRLRGRKFTDFYYDASDEMRSMEKKEAINDEDFGRGVEACLAALGLVLPTYGTVWSSSSPFQSRIPRAEAGCLVRRRRAPSWLRDDMQGER